MANDMEIAGQTRLWFPHPPATRLRDLINRPSESSCDLSAGTFNVVHYRQWSSPDFPPALRDVVQWHADDRSGAALTTTYPRGTVEVTSDYWLPGDNLRLSPGDPFADSESGFRDLLVGSPDHTDPQAALRGLALLACWHSPRQAGRTTALIALDHIRGFTFYSRVTDRAGRSGIGITAADQDSRDLLILHATTGEVLAYEGAVRAPIGWQVGFYRLYLTHTHSPDRYWEPHHAINKATAAIAASPSEIQLAWARRPSCLTCHDPRHEEVNSGRSFARSATRPAPTPP
ncbi:hypothetical protein [Micromonospora sp. WMMD1155]|uniref:hypothetical protein n=1 Tax=Micromonospora sp. WMMD1155 TaxID=3016094 RepID=UPI00249C7144|nr:hypothetical protein [Micromonospora sp. WMMD1155]WFE53046.1 hypothetical protein O7617_23200 [Micromonospora sp. WMMD1155]